MDTTYFGQGFGVMVLGNNLDGVVLHKQYVCYFCFQKCTGLTSVIMPDSFSVYKMDYPDYEFHYTLSTLRKTFGKIFG